MARTPIKMRDIQVCFKLVWKDGNIPRAESPYKHSQKLHFPDGPAQHSHLCTSVALSSDWCFQYSRQFASVHLPNQVITGKQVAVIFILTTEQPAQFFKTQDLPVVNSTVIPSPHRHWYLEHNVLCQWRSQTGRWGKVYRETRTHLLWSLGTASHGFPFGCSSRTN